MNETARIILLHFRGKHCLILYTISHYNFDCYRQVENWRISSLKHVSVRSDCHFKDVLSIYCWLWILKISFNLYFWFSYRLLSSQDVVKDSKPVDHPLVCDMPGKKKVNIWILSWCFHQILVYSKSSGEQSPLISHLLP